MNLTPAQREIARSRCRFRVLNCGRRFGKTTLAVWEMFGKAALAKNDQRIAYIAPTFQQARDIAWEMLRKICAPIIVNANESRLELTVKTQFGGTSQISLRGWEAIETLRGQRFDFLVCDEIREMRNWEAKWQSVLRPTLTDTKGEGLFISTPHGFDHFYDLFNIEKKDSDYKSFHYTSYDNPCIPSEEIDKAKAELTEDAFAQEYMADFRKHTGLIYKGFDRDAHVIEPFVIPSGWQIYRSMDFGATHPTVCLWLAVNSQDEVYVIDEHYESEKTIASHAAIINAKTRNMPVVTTWGDPSAEQAMLDYAQYGIFISPALRIVAGGETGWVKSGIEKVQTYLKKSPYTERPRLFVFNNCVNTVREFEKYRWVEKKESGVDQEQPFKVNDDAMDALRYFLVSYNLQTAGDEDWGNNRAVVNTNEFTGY